MSYTLRSLLLVAVAILVAGCATPEYSDVEPMSEAQMGHGAHGTSFGSGGAGCH